MYNIMIIDDESTIREGLINNYNWEENGYKIVAQAENGLEALNKIKINKPQIILTDIRMPVMCGIEFARKIKNIDPDIAIIFLSGYHSFDYAQKGIELGIFRFLTKPLNGENLFNTLEEVKKDLQHKQLEKDKIKQLKKQIAKSLPLLKERFFLNLVRDNYNSLYEIEETANFINEDISGSYYISMVFRLDNFSLLLEKKQQEEINIIRFSIGNILKEKINSVNNKIFTFEDRKNELGLLIATKDSNLEISYNQLFIILNEIQIYIKSFFRATISVGIGNYYKHIKDISKSYNEAQEALEYKTTFGNDSIIYIKDIIPSNSLNARIYLKEIKKLINAIKNTKLDLATSSINDLFDKMYDEQNVKIDRIHFIIIDFISKLVQIITEYSGNIDIVLGTDFVSLNILNYDNLEEIKNRVLEISTLTINFIKSKHTSKNKHLIEKVKEYIESNYYKNLNLDMIANSINISPNHLCKLFKTATGESCIDYITQIRMRHAKQLLKNSTLNIQEIADEVGFSDHLYFRTRFKKIVGIKPSEYRNNITEDFFVD